MRASLQVNNTELCRLLQHGHLNTYQKNKQEDKHVSIYNDNILLLVCLFLSTQKMTTIKAGICLQ